MKAINLFRNTVLLTLASVVFSSCSKELENDTNHKLGDKITFVANLTGTKTNLTSGTDGVYNKMIWSAGDKIGIFDASSTPQPFVTAKAGIKGIFTGEASAPTSNWYSFYPYNENAKLDADNNLHALIPEVQFSKEGGVADNVTLLYASCSSDSKTLAFKHACGLIALTIPEAVASVELEILDFDPSSNNALSGDVVVNYVDGIVKSGLINYPSVSLFPENRDEIAAGTYYIAVKPINYTGKVLLTLRTKSNKIYRKEINGLKVGAGQILPVQVNPVWRDDDGIALYTNIGDYYYKTIKGDYPEASTGYDFDKLYGNVSTKWEFAQGNAWGNRLTFYTDNALRLTNYVDNGYAIEFYLKANQKMLDLRYSDNVYFELNLNYGQQYNGLWSNSGKLFPETTLLRHVDKPSCRALNDTEWHKVSFPLVSSYVPKDIDIWQIILDPRFYTNESAAASQGAIMYIDEVRVVCKHE